MPLMPLSPKQLYQACPVSWLDFSSTQDLVDEAEPFGQERALQAIEFAAGMPFDGYNLYVAGSVGLGKFTLLEERLKELAKQQDKALSLCYVNNFEAIHKPRVMMLPSGFACNTDYLIN